MAASANDKISQVTSSNTGRPVVTTLSGAGHSIAGTSVTIAAATNWSTTTGIHFSIYETTTVGGATVKDTSTQTDWKGTLASTTISNMTLTGGTDRAYSAGAIVEITPTARWAKDLYDWGIEEHNQDGTHSAITATSIATTSGITAGSGLTMSAGTFALTGIWDGWIAVSDSWTYASATTVTVPTDATTKYSVGDKVKFTNTTLKYFTITAVAATTLTLAGQDAVTVANAAISAVSYSHSATPLGSKGFSNPYKFFVYRNAAQNVGTGSTKISFDAEFYDTNNNFTGGTYTVPVTGYYHIDASCNLGATGAATRAFLDVYKNGAAWIRGNDVAQAGSTIFGLNVSGDGYLTAGDTLEVYAFTAGAAKALDVATASTTPQNRFSGHLISAS